jgi:hypothetical protein
VQFGGNTYEVPFIVCGGGGHDVTSLVQAHLGSPAQEPKNGADVTYLDTNRAVDATQLILNRHDDQSYGFLRVTVDSQLLSFVFNPVGRSATPPAPSDSVTVDLASHTLAGPTQARRPYGSRTKPRLTRKHSMGRDRHVSRTAARR